MTAQNRQFINTDSIIKDYLVETEQGQNKYFKLWHLTFRGMDMLGLDFFYSVKSVKLPVLANKTVPLPADYINYTKVGVYNSQGEIIPLTYNGKLTTFADLQNERISKTQDNTLFQFYVGACPVWYNFWNGDAFVPLYGVPSGAPFVGSFKIDNANGVILLDDNFGYDYIALEYIPSPMEGQEYYIPVQFREAMIAWLAWKDSTAVPSRTHISLGDKAAKRHEFYNERRLANARYRPLYLQEAYDWQLSNQRLVVKS